MNTKIYEIDLEEIKQFIPKDVGSHYAYETLKHELKTRKIITVINKSKDDFFEYLIKSNRNVLHFLCRKNEFAICDKVMFQHLEELGFTGSMKGGD